jgi:NAD(P)-dependent dehydrogenase (short-subunit alcohol dehydrogenase family)
VDVLLDDKVAVITGASRGIGLAVTRALVAEGARVVAGARSTAALDGLEGVTGVAVDLAEASAPGRLVQRAIDEHGHIDVLVNNVGAVHLRLNGFLETTDSDFDEAMQLNFYTAVRASRAALAPMVAQGSGAIVNVASVNAFYQPDGNTVDYGAAKAALVNLTKSLAQEFGPRGVHVNAVSPGPVSTDLWLGENGVAATVGRSLGVDADTARRQIVAGMGGIPTGRFTTPEEVATLVVLLASERTANVTGANFVIDGGLIKTT